MYSLVTREGNGLLKPSTENVEPIGISFNTTGSDGTRHEVSGAWVTTTLPESTPLGRRLYRQRSTVLEPGEVVVVEDSGTLTGLIGRRKQTMIVRDTE